MGGWLAGGLAGLAVDLKLIPGRLGGLLWRPISATSVRYSAKVAHFRPISQSIFGKLFNF